MGDVLRMIILHGDDDVVKQVKWNGASVWTTGTKTRWQVIRTYMKPTILVAREVSDLRWNMTGIYVINVTKNTLISRETVLRGGFCMNCSLEEGLWRLRKISYI